MQSHKMRSGVLPYSIFFNIILFLLVISLCGAGIHAFRDILLRNARMTGMTLAGNYASEERSRLVVYETLLSFATASIDKRFQEGKGGDVMQWMEIFFDRLQTVLGEETVRPYIAMNGRLVGLNEQQQKKLDAIDPDDRAWFKMAVAEPGKNVFTGLYDDSVTGAPVITVARKCQNADVVVAFDIFPHHFRSRFSSDIGASYHSFFLCDGHGKILYSQMPDSERHGVKLDYVKALLQKIQNGEFEDHTSYFLDGDGNRQALYYSRMPNGWYAIVTIPQAELLKRAEQLSLVLALSAGIFLLVLIVHSWRSVRSNALVARSRETIQVLGNSYYALYRVYFIRETYECIKPSAYVQGRIASTGPYADLLQAAIDIIEPEAREEYIRSFSCENIRTLVSQKVRDFGGEFRRLFDSEYRWVSIRILFDDVLTPEEVVLCFREIEQEKLLQLAERNLLRDSLESARRSEQAKQSFFSNMSHDMRTPVNAIIGFADLARHALDNPEKAGTYIDKISYSSRQLKNLIDDILNMSRMEQGKLSLNNQEMDLKKCLQECLDTYQLQAEMEQKTLQVSLDMKDCWVMGDSVRILQLLNNLLSNAFKFTSQNDVISVSVTQAENAGSQDSVKYRIVVSDTGMGMSKDFLPHLFEPYMREVRFGSKAVAGTGLGMSISRNLVEQMNGEIRVESELGQGSTFTVVLPFVPVRTTPEGEAHDTSYESEFSFLQGMRILLAEDNMVNMELAAEMLSMHGMVVDQAWNGREAVDLFAKASPFFYNAVLMDMQMPEMDGCEATRAIRAMDRPDAGSIPVIAVTANAFAEDVASTTAAGMTAHVSKPIDFKQLFQILAECMKKADVGQCSSDRL